MHFRCSTQLFRVENDWDQDFDFGGTAETTESQSSNVFCYMLPNDKMSPHRLYCQSKRETRLEARVVLLIDVLWS